MARNYILIKKSEPFERFGNFTSKELFSRSFDAPAEHLLSEETINAWNIVRDYYKVPVTVTSTYRTFLHDTAVGGKSGTHTTGDAIDATFSIKQDKALFLPDLHKQILEKGELFHKLRMAGINGFGIYDGFVHLDSRTQTDKLKHRDEYGTFAFWDDRTSKVTPKSFFFGANCFFF